MSAGGGGVKPLDGVVVLDLTRYLAGPYGTLLLAGLGAEVVKVEPPGAGDIYRDRPPFGGPRGAALTRQTEEDMGLLMLHRARNKKSITLNLRRPEGRELFRGLCGRADVVVENYLPGTLETMGLGYPTLRQWNPRLILCSISGFGQDGARRQWRAYDPIIQAMSGISSVTGWPDRPPVRCGMTVSDTSAALYAVIGVLSALALRQRTGAGEWVDVSMLDGSFFMLADVLEFVAAGVTPTRLGNGHLGVVPFNVYPARDGHVAVCAVSEQDWDNVLAVLGREDLRRDPRFAGNPGGRREHRDEIDGLVSAWVAGRTVAEAVEALQAAHVPAGPVQSVPDAVADEHLRARGTVVDLVHPTRGPVPGAKGAGMPIRFAGHPLAFDRPAPMLGAHNAEIYGDWLGLDGARRAALERDGVI